MEDEGRKAQVKRKHPPEDQQVDSPSSPSATLGREAQVKRKHTPEDQQVEGGSATTGIKAEWEDWDSPYGYFDYCEVREKFPGVFRELHMEGDIAKGDYRLVYKVPGWAIQEARYAMRCEENLNPENPWHMKPWKRTPSKHQ